MRRRIRGTAIRVAVYAIMSLAFAFALVAVFGQFRFDSRTPYQAVFTNISGLKSGNFVRIAGVEVGKVTGSAPAPRRHCHGQLLHRQKPAPNRGHTCGHPL